MFKNHPEILAQGEILVGSDAIRQRDRALRALRPDDAGPDIRAAGFKCKFRDISDFDAFRDLLHEVDAKIIYLYRENTVKRVVSMLNAIRLEEKTGWWNLHKEENRTGPFEINPEEFDQRLQRMTTTRTQTQNLIEGLKLPVLTLKYEDILVDVDDVRRKAFSYLGVSQVQTEGNPLKATSDDLRQVITNFEDLRARYVGTEYEPMFDEVLVADIGAKETARS